MSITTLPILKAKDYSSDQEVRWCPGCGDYAILNAVHRACAKLQLRPENTVFVSGIGCSSRFPYYMETYGFHTIHGRAPGFVSGIKLANPKLDVWMVTGDGDGFSIGGNHMLHILRRNVNVHILLFNNRIYGLTKGQYSPTSEIGQKTKSSPMGSLDHPINPTLVALAAEATFVARSADKDRALPEVLEEAGRHRGAAFVEIYQNCNIFNDGAFDPLTGKDEREDNVLYLENGSPMIFGKDKNRGIRMVGNKPQVVAVGDGGFAHDDLLFHDDGNRAQAMMLAEFEHPDFPVPMGIFLREQRPVYEEAVEAQVTQSIAKRGAGTLASLLTEGETYEVK